MNQFWLTLAKPVNTNGCGWDFGGRVDLLYGTDWRYGDSLGLETNIDAQNRLYGFDLPQFYAEVGYNDLTVKIGHYAALMGYEVVPAPGNFFYSHSYELAYAEAVLVTGVQAEYKLSNNWSVNGGFNRGWGVFSDDSGDLNFLGGAKWHNDSQHHRHVVRDRRRPAIPRRPTQPLRLRPLPQAAAQQESALRDPAQLGRPAGQPTDMPTGTAWPST